MKIILNKTSLFNNTTTGHVHVFGAVEHDNGLTTINKITFHPVDIERGIYKVLSFTDMESGNR